MYEITIESAPASPYNAEWCEGICDGSCSGRYRRVTWDRAPFVVWLCHACAHSDVAILRAFQRIVALGVLEAATKDATPERWAETLQRWSEPSTSYAS